MVKSYRLILCHGFLGLPEDWNLFSDAIRKAGGPLGLEFVVDRRNLWDDMAGLRGEFGEQETDVFSAWAQRLQEDLQNSPEPKIFLGYSFGGRLLMHMNFVDVPNVAFVGYLAAHPGLLAMDDRKSRRETNEAWIRRFRDRPWAEVIRAWNQQEIFKNDRVRPERNQSAYEGEALCSYLRRWTVAEQSIRDEALQNGPSCQYWFCGENDTKYHDLLPRLRGCLGPQRGISIAGAGHGLLWDAPESLAEKVVQLLQTDEALLEAH